MRLNPAAVWLGTIGCVGALAVGCHTGPVAGSDASGPRGDSGPLVIPLVGTVPGDTVDLSCVGSATLPSGGEAVSGSLHIYEFLSNAAITSNGIDVFTNNVITDTCAAPDCTTYSTDGSGNVALTRPAGSWLAYRLAASGQTAPVMAYNQVWLTAPGESVGPGFAPATIVVVGMLFMRTFQADRLGSMSGRVQDCAGHTLSNVQMHVFVDDTEVLTGPLADPASPRITGLEATSPTRNGLTGQSGNFVGANIPPSDDCHVEAWAVRTEGAAPELIGCSEGRTVIGGITVSLVTPLRSDYAPGSRCAMAAANAGH